MHLTTRFLLGVLAPALSGACLRPECGEPGLSSRPSAGSDRGRGDGSLAERRAAARATCEPMFGADYAAHVHSALRRLDEWFVGRAQRSDFRGLAIGDDQHISDSLNDRCGEVLIAHSTVPAPADGLHVPGRALPHAL